jgi:hypothetical protein
MHIKSPETSSNNRNDDSSRADIVDWLDAPIFQENTEGLSRNIDSSPQEVFVEELDDTPDRKSDISHSAGAIAVDAVFQEIIVGNYNKSSEAYGDIYTDPWAQSNEYSPLFNEETTEHLHETSNDSHKPSFDIDN